VHQPGALRLLALARHELMGTFQTAAGTGGAEAAVTAHTQLALQVFHGTGTTQSRFTNLAVSDRLANADIHGNASPDGKIVNASYSHCIQMRITINNLIHAGALICDAIKKPQARLRFCRDQSMQEG
jgi:hypothetical protein